MAVEIKKNDYQQFSSFRIFWKLEIKLANLVYNFFCILPRLKIDMSFSISCEFLNQENILTTMEEITVNENHVCEN